MALNNSTADALASAICAALSINTGQHPEALTQWEQICRTIYSHVASDAVVNAGQAVSTTGGPTAQTGFVTTAGTLS